MKKLLVLLLLIMLFGCEAEVEEYNSETWDEIVDKEFSNFDVFAGQGVYFFEQEGEKRCVYMKYGSGVYVIGIVYHTVNVLEDGTLVLSQIDLETPDGTVIQESPVSDAVIIYSDGEMTMNELDFIKTESNAYEHFLEFIKTE